MPEEQFNMPKPPEESNEIWKVQEEETEKLRKKARKWRIFTILIGIVTIVAVVIFVVLYMDLQDSKYYWQDKYYDYRQDMQSLEKQWEIIEDCGYIGDNYAIEITDIGNGQGGSISDRDMIAENMYYMTVKFTVHLIDEKATWEEPIYIDVVNADGSIPTDEEKDGHTSKSDLSATTGTSIDRWFGWGNSNAGSLEPGLYVLVFYEGDKVIQRQEIILK